MKAHAVDQRKRWHENSLERVDEDLRGTFDWYITKKFIPYAARYKGWAVGSLVLLLLHTAFNLANPYFIGLAIDQFINQKNLHGLAMLSIVLIIINVLMWQMQYWQVWTVSWAGQQILYHLSSDMFTHLQHLSLGFFDKTQVGRVMSRLQSDIDALESMLSSGLFSMIGSLVALIGIIGAMLAMNVGLALLSFIVLPIMIIIAAFWQRYARRSFRRTRAAISLVNAMLQESISGIRVIQSLAREGRNHAEFAELNAYNCDTNQEANRISALVLPLVEIVAALAIAMIVLYGGVLVSQGKLQVGILVAFTLYINRFFDPIRDISQQYSQLQRAGVAAERIFQIMDTPVEIVDKPEAEQLDVVRGEVEFRGVTFGYSQDVTVLHNFNLHIKAGQTVAIVGPTGAGKSTIAGLLVRFYDIQQGAILIDEHDVRDVTQCSLRSQVGIVLQEPVLFTGTIRDNIRYGRLEATDVEIEEAARAVGAHELIMQIPDGYAALIRERGCNLSAGQRQLISFARALLADPRILILDEATANIDTFTELLVQQGLKRLLNDRTAIIIAHRLSTIKNADCIIVLQKGQIIERGTHAELLEKQGAYASLYAMGFRDPSHESAELVQK